MQLVPSPQVSSVTMVPEVVAMLSFHKLSPLGASVVLAVFSPLLIRDSSLTQMSGENIR